MMPVVEQPASSVMLRTVRAAARSRWRTVRAAVRRRVGMSVPVAVPPGPLAGFDEGVDVQDWMQLG